MLGISKKVERVRVALHDAMVARANQLVTTQSESNWQARAMVLLDLADIVRRLLVDAVDIESDIS